VNSINSCRVYISESELSSSLQPLTSQKLIYGGKLLLDQQTIEELAPEVRLTLHPPSFPDHFLPHGKNWSGERPIPFSFPAIARIVM